MIFLAGNRDQLHKIKEIKDQLHKIKDGMIRVLFVFQLYFLSLFSPNCLHMPGDF